MKPDDDPRWSPARKPVAPTRCPECDAAMYSARPACEHCGVVRCRLCPEPCVGCARAARIDAMLADRAMDEGPGDPQGADETFDFVLSLGDERDVRIDARGVFVRPQRARAAHGYLGWTAPGVVARLMRAIGLRAILGPVVGIVPAIAPYRTTRIARQLAWLLPTRGGLEGRFRPAAVALDRFDPRPIPDEGALALPACVELAPFTADVAFVEHGRDVACPHCRSVARRHRDANDGWIVCAACGRSFRSASSPV